MPNRKENVKREAWSVHPPQWRYGGQVGRGKKEKAEGRMQKSFNFSRLRDLNGALAGTARRLHRVPRLAPQVIQSEWFI
jgi:hypothetical protein